MSETTKPIEFEVNFVDYADGKVFVSERNYERDIAVGEVFLWVYRVTVEEVKPPDFTCYYSDSKPFSLCVEAIEAYRRNVDLLDQDSSGDLRSYDLLRGDKYEAARRPSGLAEGEFVVPDDFDDPLPNELQRLFEWRE